MFCPKCGTKNDDDAAFCENCGEQLLHDSQVIETSQSGEPKKKHREKAIAAAVASILVLGVLIAFFILRSGNFFGRAHNATDNTSQKIESSPSFAEESAANQVEVAIQQIDTSKFPQISLYVTIGGDKGSSIKQISNKMFLIQDGNMKDIIPDVVESTKNIPISVALTLDNSGSMNGSAFNQAKTSAKSFLNYVDFSGGDSLEVTEFNSDVYVRLPYSGDQDLLNAAIDSMECTGETALYDAIYLSIVRAYSQSGQKCVLVFTDGIENASKRTLDEVIELSDQTGIPVYIIGVGTSIDESALKDLADCTGGSYYYSPTTEDLEAIYQEVYDLNKEMIRIDYKVKETEDLSLERLVSLSLDDKQFSGKSDTSYVPSVDDNLPLEFLYESVSASSVLESEESTLMEGVVFEYIPYHATDGDDTTIWSEGASGYGINEWWQIAYVRPVSLSGLYIKNGYWRLEERLAQNGRVKKLRVTFSDGNYEDFSLGDPTSNDFQTLLSSNGDRLQFSKAYTTSSVRVTILDAYPGTKWEDTCVTEIVPFR